jgi:hypothetical protein
MNDKKGCDYCGGNLPDEPLYVWSLTHGGFVTHTFCGDICAECWSFWNDPYAYVEVADDVKRKELPQ